MATAPTPGEAAPGQLLCDPNERTIWLGVDASVDPNRSLLISDIVGMQAADAETLETANDYTDAAVATRALVRHEHKAVDITDFDDAVNLASKGQSFCKNMVIMWWGNPANVGFDWSPTGANNGGENMIGWAICNGNNGTPNLTGKYILAAANSVGSPVEPGELINVSTEASHTHGVETNGRGVTGLHRLTIAEMPAHAHGHTRDATHSPGVMLVHGQPDTGTGNVNSFIKTAAGNDTTNKWDEANMKDEGGGDYHSHTIDKGGAHNHQFARHAGNVPHYSMMYIMRIQ